MDFPLSLSLSVSFSAPLREPVAIYLPVSNYSLVNTEQSTENIVVRSV